jgi:hypothetical protein
MLPPRLQGFPNSRRLIFPEMGTDTARYSAWPGARDMIRDFTFVCDQGTQRRRWLYITCMRNLRAFE